MTAAYRLDLALVLDVAAVLLAHDPAGIDHGQDPLEYRSEAEEIAAGLAAATSPTDLAARVHDCLAYFFTPQIAGSPADHAALVADLWGLGDRPAVLARLLGEVRRVHPGAPALVAVDGVDGVGKSHLVGELASLAAAVPGRPVLTTSIDGFHRPRAQRRAAGAGPEGFYRGSYRYDAFRVAVVDPLRAGRPIVPAVWDVARDEPVPPAPLAVPADAVLLVDGLFLHRPELADVWDASVWVHAPSAVTVPRGNARFPGEHDPDPDPDPEAAANERYVGGQRRYLAEVDPASRATWLLDNRDLARPVLTLGA